MTASESDRVLSMCSNSQLLLPSSQDLAGASLYSLDSQAACGVSGHSGTLLCYDTCHSAHTQRSAKPPKPSAPEQPGPPLHLLPRGGGGSPEGLGAALPRATFQAQNTALPSRGPTHLV